MMTLRFDDRRALVTGGTRGVGRAVSLALAGAGARVIATYRDDEESAAQLAQEPDWNPVRCHVLRADVTDAGDRIRLVAAARGRLGGLDILVNNVGSYRPLPFAELTPEIVEDTLRTNLTAHLLLTQGLLPLLGDDTSVINVGAGIAQRGRAEHAHFTAAKAGMHGFTRSLAKEVGPRGIRVNTVAPGVVDTGHESALPAARRAEITSAIPLRRLATAADVANVVVFLASKESSFVSGTAIRVDGGL
jgi:NAD(P)-dependent dehydrogenase (short-subunit alcohol dehydrogenase family)